MSTIPMISVVMPLYNKEREVNRAIQSVLNQTVTDLELIVVNDGSTDKGPDLVRSINDPRIRLIEQENAGVSAARNRGIEEARSELIAFLDADDEWKTDFLETIVRLRSNHPSCSVFSTNYLFYDVKGSQRFPIIRGVPGFPWEGILTDYFGVASKSDPPLFTSAVAVKKQAMAAIGGFPTGVTFGEDFLTWAKLALKYNIAYSTRPCTMYWIPMRIHDRPGRFNNLIDIVGQELEKLIEDAESTKAAGLKRYAALWHKMRASILLSLGDREGALTDIKMGIRLSRGINLKLRVYRVIALTPGRLSGSLFESINFIWCLWRRYLERKLS